MTRPNRLRLTGCRCQCTACFECFGSVRAFDRHRTGEYARPGTWAHTRRCLTLAEMVSAGWQRNARGFLLTPDARRAGVELEGRISAGGAASGEGCIHETA